MIMSLKEVAGVDISEVPNFIKYLRDVGRNVEVSPLSIDERLSPFIIGGARISQVSLEGEVIGMLVEKYNQRGGTDLEYVGKIPQYHNSDKVCLSFSRSNTTVERNHRVDHHSRIPFP